MQTLGFRFLCYIINIMLYDMVLFSAALELTSLYSALLLCAEHHDISKTGVSHPEPAMTKDRAVVTVFGRAAARSVSL